MTLILPWNESPHQTRHATVVDHVLIFAFDGAWLPYPETGPGAGEPAFRGRALRIARLIHAIDYQVDADEAERMMRRSGLRIID